MSKYYTEGQENVPERPVMVLPNRLDAESMQELERLLGGFERVAWMVEHSLRPDATVMGYLAKVRAAGMICSVDGQSREVIGEKVREHLNYGRHVVLLPGPVVSRPGSVSGVPGRLLSFFDEMNLPALPAYVSEAYGAEDGGGNDREIRLMPVQRPGAGLGTRVLAAWMEAAADQFARHPLPEQACLPKLLMQRMAAHAHARLIDGVDDSSLTFRELMALAIMFTRVLRRHTQHRRIGILLPPGKSSVIANLACWLCGIVPVNFNYRENAQRFRAQVAVTGVTRFITEERFVQKQNHFPWPRQRDLLFVDRELTEMGRNRLRFNYHLLHFCSQARLAKFCDLAAPGADEEAAVLFTSGVDGDPLPVSLTHRMLLASVMQIHRRTGMEKTDSVLSSLPAYTPWGLTLGLLQPLLYGQDMITYPDPDAGRRLCTLMRQYSIRFFCTTPGCLRCLLEHAEVDKTFVSVRCCLTAGERLPTDLARDAQQRFGLTVCDGYGMVETAGLMTLNLPSLPAAELTVIPSGKPGTAGAVFCGTAVRFTDPTRTEQVLPPSATGLLWVRGPAVMRAYAEHAEATAARRHGNWFCTGDIARMDADGILTIGGRRNRFSRINGEMVAHEKLEMLLGKILKLDAETMRRHPICVVSLPDRAHGERLYLLSTVHRIGRPNDLLAMRYGLMNEGYPSAWTPEMILPVTAIPLLPDGKLNTPACYQLARHVLSKIR